MDVSVIIVNYNTRDLTGKSSESFIRFTKEVSYEIILIDNASVDDSVEVISQQYPLVKIIRSSTNLGFGNANNKGIELAKGEFVFLLNSDAFLTSNGILAFTAFMRSQQNTNVAICGGELFTGREDTTVSYGNFPSLTDAFSSIGFFILYREYHNRYIASGIVNRDPTPRKVDYINGANMFIRKSVLEEVGVFNRDFFLYFEETELSKRINNKGYISMIVPDVKIIHLGSASQGIKKTFNYLNFFHYCKGRNLYFNKCHGKLYCFLTQVCYALTEINYSLLGKRKGNLVKKLNSIFFAK